MLKNKAQSLTEYSICLAILLIALITMNFYVKRGLQGRYRDVMDYTISKVAEKANSQATLESLKQYEPYYKYAESTTNAFGRKIIGTTISVGGSINPGNFKRELPATEISEEGQYKQNYMKAGSEFKKEAEQTIKNALSKNQ